ncbi:hypothetical protein [Bradyrhizobium sp. CCGUVB23]|uniref:hypothetical protein n=1 Tax=Bradyrhizobium sp. CCGUVB23 TaxID=2949630 RepID=UPI0020B2A914|nr:hypothetical protein [Bradyrhizobium sp. CCGUVB23]MCP3460754.1 hypothetical protein [Bradyrhizobium sp. CCGUVB23]
MTVIVRLERRLLEGGPDLREEFDGEITVLAVGPADGSDSFPKVLSSYEPAVLFADSAFADAGSRPINYARAAAILKKLQEI